MIKMGRKTLPWVRSLFFASLLALLVNQFGFVLSVVNGYSMEPTLEDGDRLLVNKLAMVVDSPELGDVITFEDPGKENRYLVKRVVGLPGDRIEGKNGRVYRNNKPLRERYVESTLEDGDFGPIVVQAGTLFVLGDNRTQNASRDSRYESVGLVPMDKVDGKVMLILWRPSLAASL
ncbi:signal peptidase I [Mechercharimyces sp. CAU 1602]|uniref:signal peptidase I n=1 Tax=Mechercharimyces sp. CAU 1602 TaxID=2973933 RepID=UPI002163DAA5|nr:signal peptidase I [Mechercharimyces sp. CAU 1602]MCS1352750.1 signal peptidase I [Mechercharimyces sp. CAU 1602]